MKNVLVAFVLLAVISVSGCTGNNLIVQNAGGVINEFTFDFGSIYDDESTVLTAEIMNVGGKTIDTTYLYVYGQTLGSNEEVWQLLSSQPGVTQETPYIKDVLTDAEFYPPDVEQGTPGGSQIYNFILDPPDLPDGIVDKPNMQFYARLCFPYSTSTITMVELTSTNEMRATQMKSSKAETINAAGPIQLELKTQKNIRSAAGKALPLVFSVRDVGGGFATLPEVECNVDTDTSDRYWVEVQVKVDGEPADCGNGRVYMRKGEGTLYCKKDFGNTEAPRTNFRVSATASYNYYVEKAASVQVTDSSID